jgi:hypothetical protein
VRVSGGSQRPAGVVRARDPGRQRGQLRAGLHRRVLTGGWGVTVCTQCTRYTCRMQLTHSLKAHGFNPWSYSIDRVKNRFQSLLSDSTTCLYRYTTVCPTSGPSRTLTWGSTGASRATEAWGTKTSQVRLSGLSLTPGCQMGLHARRVVTHGWVSDWSHARRVVTPGCHSIGYMEHTGYHRLNRVLTAHLRCEKCQPYYRRGTCSSWKSSR